MCVVYICRTHIKSRRLFFLYDDHYKCNWHCCVHYCISLFFLVRYGPYHVSQLLSSFIFNLSPILPYLFSVFGVKTSLGVPNLYGNKCTTSHQHFIVKVFTIMLLSCLCFLVFCNFLLLNISYCLIVFFQESKF